jgi:hypothetical protein
MNLTNFYHAHVHQQPYFIHRVCTIYIHLIKWFDCSSSSSSSRRRRSNLTSVSHYIRCTIYIYTDNIKEKEQSNRRVLAYTPVHICRCSTQSQRLKRIYAVNVVVVVVVDIIIVENRTLVDREETSKE